MGGWGWGGAGWRHLISPSATFFVVVPQGLSQSAALVAEKLAYYNVCEQTAAGTVARRVQDGEHLKKPSQVRHNEAVRLLILRYGALPKKVSGSLAGVPVLFTVVGRARLRVLGAHNPIMAGIDYDEQSGTVYSVVESGGYADDEDLGDVIWYVTGTGPILSMHL